LVALNGSPASFICLISRNVRSAVCALKSVQPGFLEERLKELLKQQPAAGASVAASAKKYVATVLLSASR